MLVRKKDGRVRWCKDFRDLNKLCAKDAYPLPLMEECVDTLSGSVFFSSLDMNAGYWQIELAEEDRHKSAFITKYGLYEYCRMPSGLSGAPSTFQRAMHLVLRGLTWDIALCYLDDVAILGACFSSHLSNVREVLERFRTYHLKLKPRKCVLFQKEITFLGRVVSGEGVAVEPSKITAVTKWPVPKNVREVESYLGFINYHRDHLEGLAGKAAILYELTGPQAKFEWDERHEEAFASLKEALVCAPVLSLPWVVTPQRWPLGVSYRKYKMEWSV